MKCKKNKKHKLVPEKESIKKYSRTLTNKIYYCKECDMYYDV
jgi:hypothetical protein